MGDVTSGWWAGLHLSRLRKLIYLPAPSSLLKDDPIIGAGNSQIFQDMETNPNASFFNYGEGQTTRVQTALATHPTPFTPQALRTWISAKKGAWGLHVEQRPGALFVGGLC